jgi:hypothetical protein
MKKVTGVLIGLCLLLSNSFMGIAQNPAQWQEARQRFIEKKNSPNPTLRFKVAKELVDAIYPTVEYDAATLLVEHIKNEIERAKGNIDREVEVRFPVIEISIEGLKKVTQTKAVEYLVKVASDVKSNWRVRFYVIQAFAVINTPTVINALVKLIDEPNIPIKIASFRSLTELNVPDATQRSCQLLDEDITWEVKVAAVEYLTMLNSPELVEPLINVIQNESLDGCVRIKVVDLLKKLTGEDMGISGRPWLEWWKKKQEGEKAPVYRPGETISIIPVLYYGITVTSARTIFIMDISDSMGQTATFSDEHYSRRDESEDPCKRAIKDAESREEPINMALIEKLRELKKKLDVLPVTSRFGAARKELANAVYYLDPSVEFTIITFDRAQYPWKETLVSASIENKIAALEYMYRKLGLGMGTYFYEILELVYKFVGKEQEQTTEAPPLKSGYGTPLTGVIKPKKWMVHLKRNCNYINEFGGADNVFMVTDGSGARMGKIIDKNEIVNEIKKLSQIRGIRFNIIAVGEPPINPDLLHPTLDVDIKFLSKLAESTGGVFKDKTSKATKPKNN